MAQSIGVHNPHNINITDQQNNVFIHKDSNVPPHKVIPNPDSNIPRHKTISAGKKTLAERGIKQTDSKQYLKKGTSNYDTFREEVKRSLSIEQLKIIQEKLGDKEFTATLHNHENSLADNINDIKEIFLRKTSSIIQSSTDSLESVSQLQDLGRNDGCSNPYIQMT